MILLKVAGSFMQLTWLSTELVFVVLLEWEIVIVLFVSANQHIALC